MDILVAENSKTTNSNTIIYTKKYTVTSRKFRLSYEFYFPIYESHFFAEFHLQNRIVLTSKSLKNKGPQICFLGFITKCAYLSINHKWWHTKCGSQWSIINERGPIPNRYRPRIYSNYNINETINCNLLLMVPVDRDEYHRSISYLNRRLPS